MSPRQPDAHEALIQRQVDSHCLAHQVTWLKRSLTALPVDLLWGALAWRAGVAWQVWVLWLAVRLLMHLVIVRLAGRWMTLVNTDPRQGLRLAQACFVTFGLWHAVLMPVFYFGTDEVTKLLAMALAASYFGGVIISASGQQGTFWGTVLPSYAVYIAGWVSSGGWLSWVMVFTLVQAMPLVALSIRQQRRSWETLVRLHDEKQTLATELAVERDRVQAAADQRTRFFAAASHDLRQPLHALSINATTLALLANRSDDAQLRALSEGIGRALAHSQGLLDGLLDIARLDAGAVRLRMADIDVSALLRQLQTEFVGIAAQRGLGFTVDLADGVAWARSDADQLQRILRNLLDNAFKFTDSGVVRLSLVRMANDSGAADLCIQVADTGCGIAPQDRERVFEEFYQVGNPSRDRSRGLGLGLAIVRRTALLIGARVQLLDAPGGRGALFEVRLPALAEPGLPGPANGAGRAQGDLPGLPVLLVDDEPDILQALSGLLLAVGWTPHPAADADGALALAARPSLALSVAVVDSRLPQGDGIELVGRLRALRPGLPALIVTGDMAVQWDVCRHGLRVLHKPLDGATLTAAIAEEVGAAARWAARLDTFQCPEGTEPMNIIDAMHGRRSIRNYHATPVLRDTVEDLIWHAAQVPRPPISGTDSWAFVVVEGVDRLAGLGARAKRYAAEHQPPGETWAWATRRDFDIFWGAPLLVLICARHDHPEAAYDCCRAGQNLTLAAHAAGLGSCWIGSALPWLNSADGRTALAMPAGYDVAVALVLGRAVEVVEGRSQQRPAIHWCVVDAEDELNPPQAS